MKQEPEIMTEEIFKRIYKDEKFRNEVAFAIRCETIDGKFKYFRTNSYPKEYQVTPEQIKIAEDVRLKAKEEIIKNNREVLLFTGMGMVFDPIMKGGCNNHRIRTSILNDDSKYFFIELSAIDDKKHFMINHSIKRSVEKDEDINNYGRIEKSYKHTKYNHEEILKIVNEEFGCSFKKMVIDNYTLSPDDYVSVSPRGSD